MWYDTVLYYDLDVEEVSAENLLPPGTDQHHSQMIPFPEGGRGGGREGGRERGREDERD